MLVCSQRLHAPLNKPDCSWYWNSYITIALFMKSIRKKSTFWSAKKCDIKILISKNKWFILCIKVVNCEKKGSCRLIRLKFLKVLKKEIIFMDVIYYHYFLFYQKVIKDDEPHLLTIMVLSASFSFPLMIGLQLLSVFSSCETINTWVIMSIIPVMIYINYRTFYKSKRHLKIVETKPLFFNNPLLSCLMTFTFFLLTASTMFIGPIFMKAILENRCER